MLNVKLAMFNYRFIKVAILVVLSLCFSSVLHAQHENDIWYFGGGNAGMSYSHSQKAFAPYSDHQPLGWEGCAVATDPTTGDMMFYTDGNTVYNRDHIVMPGGDNFGGHPSSAQAVAIVPVPGDCGRYYVFSNSKGGSPTIGELYYSIVDITANSGDGAVTNSNILLRSNILEGMIAIPKPNSNDFWLVGSDNNTTTFYVFAITATGISAPQLFNIGPDDYRYCLSFSEKAGKIAASYPAGLVYVFDFADTTGSLSNAILIDSLFPNAYSSEWSPDGSKLYYSSWRNGASIRQYDFDNLADPITDIYVPSISTDSLNGGGLKLGPDGKIYFIHSEKSSFLSCIGQPDTPGLACQFQLDYIDLGTPVMGLNLPATLAPVWTPENCQRPAWRARVTSINGYDESPELLRDVVQNGIAYIPKALSDKDYYWTQFVANLPQAIQVSGSISMECRLRNSKSRGGIDAFDVGMWLSDGNKSGEVVYMGNPTAVSYAQIRFGEQIQSNIPDLVADFEGWRIIKLEITPNLLRTFVDNQLRYEFPFEGSLCRLSLFGISFKGSGEVDWISLFDGSGNLLYFEDFLSPCDFACIDAEPAQDEYINRYAAVEAICSNRLTVSHPENFNPGDHVLLIQMQGAIANITDDTLQAGKVLDFGTAGNYEINVVEIVSGNNVFLRNEIIREYDTAGRVQLVHVPDFGNAKLNCVSCPPWNGRTGGVLAFIGKDITLAGDVDVSGKGFRGGALFNEQTQLHNVEYLYFPTDTTANVSGFKGESIALLLAEKARGRAPHANGGGPGNAHNYGGGGSGNAGNGGQGGRWSSNLPDNAGEGMGGHKLQYNNLLNKVFLGGGGGSGHSNNGKGSRGGNGGGIILVIADNLLFRGGALRANGESPPAHSTWPANNDGGGGGGGGGAIMLDVSGNISTEIIFEAKGGNGTSVEYRHGHGGGGGGGILWVRQWQGGKAVLTGGSPGIGTDGQTNGAVPGGNGFVLTGLSMPRSQNKYEFLAISHIKAEPDCSGTATVTVSARGGVQPWLFSRQNGTWAASGEFADLSGGYHLFQIEDGCGEKRDSSFFVQTYSPIEIAVEQKPQHCDSLGHILVEAMLGKAPYHYWQNDVPWASGIMRDLAGDRLYEIRVRDALGCEILMPIWLDDLSETIQVTVEPPALSIVKGGSADLSGTASTSYISPYWYQWMPSYWLSPTVQANTTATPEITTTYTLHVQDAWGCTGEASAVVTVIVPSVYFPNVFRPDDNMVPENGLFTAMSAEGVARIKQLAVYDRWGNLVFAQHNFQPGDLSKAWDGTYKGQPMPSGVYAYLVETEYIDGTSDVSRGDVLLVR